MIISNRPTTGGKMIRVDAVGLTCPMPIIKTKKALKGIESGKVEVSVDNDTSKENLEKMAGEMGLSFETSRSGDTWKVTIDKKETVEVKEAEKSSVIVIASDRMGDGDEELGKTLLKGFIYTLTEMETLPKTMLFYNAGAKVTAEGSVSIEDLKELESRGVEVLTCGACLNYYELNLGVGSVSNMYSIIEKQMTAERIVRV